jgi:hypothetical protein
MSHRIEGAGHLTAGRVVREGAAMTTTTLLPARAQSADSSSVMGSGLSQAGALCAVVQAVWIALLVTAMSSFAPAISFSAYLTGAEDAASKVAALSSGAGFYGALVALVTLGSAVMVVVVVALRERLRSSSPGLVAIGSMFGYFAGFNLLLGNGFAYTLVSQTQRLPQHVLEQEVPAIAVGTSVTLGIGLFTLGLWIGLLSLAALRGKGLPGWFAYLGLLTAVVDMGILVGPPIGLIPTIAWFLALGVVMLRRQHRARRPG